MAFREITPVEGGEDGEGKYKSLQLYLVSFLLILKAIVFLWQKWFISILIHHLICPIVTLVTSHIAVPRSFKTVKVHRELHTFFCLIFKWKKKKKINSELELRPWHWFWFSVLGSHFCLENWSSKILFSKVYVWRSLTWHIRFVKEHKGLIL